MEHVQSAFFTPTDHSWALRPWDSGIPFHDSPLLKKAQGKVLRAAWIPSAPPGWKPWYMRVGDTVVKGKHSAHAYSHVFIPVILCDPGWRTGLVQVSHN